MAWHLMKSHVLFSLNNNNKNNNNSSSSNNNNNKIKNVVCYNFALHFKVKFCDVM